ncbi:MAG TPA: acyl-CoA dehydrogenase family protein [Phenylobacterium sp.]|nr:acyl-CoA dehydrogenase family protein [Phenylobacterium sp.]
MDGSSPLGADGWPVPRQADRLADDRFLPGELVKLRKETRAFADELLRPLAHELNTTPERADGFRRDVFDALADAGLFRTPFSVDVGGRGLEFPTSASLIVLEELAYYTPGVASAMYDAHVLLVGNVLDEAGGAVRATYLPGLIKGEFVGAFATSEPAASTDLSPEAIQTVAVPTEGGWRVSGRKRWITNAPAADVLVLLCRTGAGLSLLLVDMGAPGITVGVPDLKMGNHAQLTADIILDNVFVPQTHLLGTEGGGLRAALGSLTLGRMGIGSVGVGMAQRAFDVASAYIARRQVRGQPIAARQHWQFRFADHAMELEAARSLVQKAGRLRDDKADPGHIAAMAKIKGSRVAVDMARDAIQCCGGYGFARALEGGAALWPLEAIYRDSKIGEIYEGANEVLQWVIARRIFGREITG